MWPILPSWNRSLGPVSSLSGALCNSIVKTFATESLKEESSWYDTELSYPPSTMVRSNRLLVFHAGGENDDKLWYNTFDGDVWTGDTLVSTARRSEARVQLCSTTMCTLFTGLAAGCGILALTASAGRSVGRSQKSIFRLRPRQLCSTINSMSYRRLLKQGALVQLR